MWLLYSRVALIYFFGGHVHMRNRYEVDDRYVGLWETHFATPTDTIWAFRHSLPKVVRRIDCSTCSVKFADYQWQTYIGSTKNLFATSAWWYKSLLYRSETSWGLKGRFPTSGIYRLVRQSPPLYDVMFMNIIKCSYYLRVAHLSLSMLYVRLLFEQILQNQLMIYIYYVYINT